MMKRFLISALIAASISFNVYARQPQQGYRGFAEWSNSLRVESYDGFRGSSTTFYTGVSTSHGYQINPMFFAGAGMDFEHCADIDSSILAFFAQGRADFKFGGFTPYADARIGYNLAHGGGVYFSPAIGYRINWGRKMGLNLGVGLTVQGYTAYTYDFVIDPDGFLTQIHSGKKHSSVAFFSFRVGIDF